MSQTTERIFFIRLKIQDIDEKVDFPMAKKPRYSLLLNLGLAIGETNKITVSFLDDDDVQYIYMWPEYRQP